MHGSNRLHSLGQSYFQAVLIQCVVKFLGRSKSDGICYIIGFLRGRSYHFPLKHSHQHHLSVPSVNIINPGKGLDEPFFLFTFLTFEDM